MSERPTLDLPLANILEPSHRLRASIDPQKLGELADDIAANGLHQPIGVRGPLPGDHYEIIFGHRRYLAHQLLRRDTITVRLYPPDYDPLHAAVAENEQRENLTPYEQALIVQRYTERGEPLAAIARYLRKSLPWVQQRAAILTWPRDLQDAIHHGTLTLGVADALAAIDHDDYRTQLLDEARRTGATARTVEVWKAHFLADRQRIVSNHLAVEEIAAERDAWVIMVPCDLCGEKHEYPDTRQLRACGPCMDLLSRLVAEEAARAAHDSAGSTS